MTVSACLIVKNEEQLLGKTLPNLVKQLDEVIVLDTGSTDKTIEIARQLGAKVYHFTWINDFAAARNESLKHAASDWILWIDADEFMKEEDLKRLKEILKEASANAFSLYMFESKLFECEQKHSYLREKVFRNHLGIHFEREINEQVVDQDGKRFAAPAIDIPIYHWGKHLSEASLNEKRLRYVKHYSAALEKNPTDPYLHYLLANNLAELKKLTEALKHYTSSFELGSNEEIGKKALEKKVDLLLKLKDIKAANETAQALLVLDPKSVIARRVMATILLICGQVDESISLLQEALSLKLDFKVGDLTQTKAMPNFLLGKAYQLKGDKEKARYYLDQAAEIAPELTGKN